MPTKLDRRIAKLATEAESASWAVYTYIGRTPSPMGWLPTETYARHPSDMVAANSRHHFHGLRVHRVVRASKHGTTTVWKARRIP